MLQFLPPSVSDGITNNDEAVIRVVYKYHGTPAYGVPAPRDLAKGSEL